MKKNTPVCDMLKRYRKRTMRFHVPGHKGALPITARDDVTELSFSDNLLQPEGVLAEAQKLFAASYGADWARFVTCGATAANLALLGCFSGQTVVFDRCSHVSAYHALELFGVRPVFVNHPAGVYPSVLTAEETETALAAHPEASAVFVTTPNYYGESADGFALRKVCDRHGVKLLADACHGSHYAFSDLLPPSASEFSDAAVFSVHKTGLGLTQSAAAVGRGKELESRFFTCLKQIHTTSPSYLLLSSIDFSRAFMVQYYNERAKKQFSAVNRLKQTLAKCGMTFAQFGDFTRLVANVSGLGYSGWEAERALNRVGVFPEFADGKNVAFVLSATDSVGKINALCRALKKLSRTRGTQFTPLEFSAQAECAVAYEQAAGLATELVPLSGAVGRVSGANVGLYPPGVPLAVKGEILSEELVRLLTELSEHTFGLQDSDIEVII